MFGTRTAIMALALAAPMLGGCQSIFGRGLTIRPIENVVKPSDEASYAAAQVEAGRKALDDGQVSAAIAAFRNAKLYADQAAAASNGLAIAYSQLGRPDLAERYFQQAVAMEPGDKRYQANLQRFYQINQVEMTMAASDKLPPVAAVQASETRLQLMSQAGTPTTVIVSRPEQRLVRLSAGEVGLGKGQPAPRQSPVTAQSPVTVQRNSGTATPYPVRVGFAPREIFVGKAPPAGVPARTRPAAEVAVSQKYPLRVELK